MRIRLFTILLILTTVTQQAGSQITEKMLQQHIRVLASDSLQGRKSGTEYERKAANYIRNYFQKLGLKLLADSGFQSFAYTGLSGPKVSQNVIAILEGSDPVLRQECVVIGAHYDHIGKARFPYSRHWLRGGIHYGADDNASGTALMLEMANALASKKGNLPRSVVFVAFGAEEEGLQGSAYLASHLPDEVGKVFAMINFDMVGRLGKDKKLFVSGSGTADEMEQLLAQIHVPDGLQLVKFPGGKGPTDSQSFYLKNIPVLSFITGLHKDYHTPGDIEKKINYEGMVTIASYTLPLAEELVRYPGQLTYRKNNESLRTNEITLLPSWRFTGHLRGFSLGLTSVMNNHYGFDFPLEYEFIKNRLFPSIYLMEYPWEFGIKIVRNLGVVTAPGIGYTSLALPLKPVQLINPSGDSLSSYTPDYIGVDALRSHRYNSWKIVLPVFLEYKIPSERKSAYIAAGVTGSLLIDGKIKYTYKKNGYRYKEVIRGPWFARPWQLSAQIRAGSGNFGFFADIALTPLFKKEKAPAFFPVTGGIAINLNR